MYAVIKTGGKQYRVQPGDMLVVEKLDGDVGANVKFDQVLMHGDGDTITLGGPLVDGALVHATLIETRKGEKVKIFKKIRRQGYRRTRGHRQWESVLRVTGLEIGGETTKWEGEVKLESRALINAKARGLKNVIAELEGSNLVPAVVEAAPAKKSSKAAKKAVAEDVVDQQEVASEAIADAPKPKKAKAPKAEAAADSIDTAGTEADGVTVADVEAAPKKKATPKAKPASETK